MGYYGRYLVILICAVLLAGCTAAPTPASTSTPLPPVTAAPTDISVAPTTAVPESTRLFGGPRIVGTTPAIPHGAAGSWDAATVSPGGAVFVDGTYYLFHKGLDHLAGPYLGAVGYSTSTDGLTWTRHPEPVTEDAGLSDLGPPGVMPGTVLIEPDGQWVMYFWLSDPRPEFDHISTIWRAVSPGPDGPWVADPQEPILSRGEEGGWDYGGVYAPSVVKLGDQYIMLYAATELNGQFNVVGMATSPDGITWQKRADPVFEPSTGGGWDSGSVQEPRVDLINGELVMAYTAWGQGQMTASIGLARSADGDTWERYHANPVMIIDDIPGGGFFHIPNLFAHDSKTYLFAEVVNGDHTDIWLSILDGAIDW
jgi:predicted GH43/DUF377 family glycosyl hydrolase